MAAAIVIGPALPGFRRYRYEPAKAVGEASAQSAPAASAAERGK